MSVHTGSLLRGIFKAPKTVPPTLPPGPKFIPFPAIRGDIMGALSQLAHKYGDMVYLNLFGNRVFLLNHPDLVREVLVAKASNFVKGRGLKQAERIVLGKGLLTSEGEEHRKMRQRIQPIFQRQAVERYAPATVDCALRFLERWQAEAGQDAPRDIFQEMMRLTLSVVSKTTFDIDLDVEAGAKTVASAVIDLSEWLFYTIILPFARFIEKLPFGPGPRVREAREALEAMVYSMIADRRANGPRNDLLSMLMQEGEGKLDDRQIRDHAMIALLGGTETMANTLTWTWYLLSQNPEAEARLHAELDTVLGDRPPTVADLERLTYTRQVLAESMRMYPPAWKIDRRAVEDCEIGGYQVPAGSYVVMSQWVIHHDPRYYPDPFRFDPERWTPESQAARPKYAYFPFGGGARVCIGEHLAWLQGVLLLATVAQRWRLRLAPGHPVVLRQRINLRPKYGMRMTLEERK